MNKKCVELLKEVIQKNYKNVRQDGMSYDDNEFYYEFNSDEQISENDFKYLEDEIKKLDNSVFVKLLRISGVYYEGNANNEMITRIVGKSFSNEDELDKYNEFLAEAKERDHRKIGQDLDLFCFSDYVGFSARLFGGFIKTYLVALSGYGENRFHQKYRVCVLLDKGRERGIVALY